MEKQKEIFHQERPDQPYHLNDQKNQIIIDIHTHAFEDRLAKSAMEILSARAGLKNTFDGTVAGLVESMKQAGISMSVLQPVATKPSQVVKINDWAAGVAGWAKSEAKSHYPQILPFAGIHPDYEGWREELHRIREMGLKGIKLHPDYQGFFLDEDRMVPLYEEAIRLGLVIMIHSGRDIGLPEPIHCTPERIGRMMGLFRGARVIFAHMGAYDMYDDVEKYILGSDVFIDTSMAAGRMGREQALRIMRGHRVEKVLFGTDAPWSEQKWEVEFMGSLGLTGEEYEAVMWKNAARLLGLGQG